MKKVLSHSEKFDKIQQKASSDGLAFMLNESKECS